MPKPRVPDAAHIVLEPRADTTLLETDDLQSLFHFTNQSLNETAPEELVARDLAIVLRQTGADHAGFLSLDEAVDLRLVLPRPWRNSIRSSVTA